MNLSEILPGRTDRAVLIGHTGFGKTYLAEHLLKDRQWVVVHDGKGLINWSNYKKYQTLDQVVRAKDERIIYSPGFIELKNKETQNEFYRWIYDRGNTTIYTDEVYTVCDRAIAPFYLEANITRGRERGISTISSTQRPKQISQVILSEAEHFYIFWHSLPQDRQRIREIVAIDEEEIRGLREKEFIYYGNRRRIGPNVLIVNGGENNVHEYAGSPEDDGKPASSVNAV